MSEILYHRRGLFGPKTELHIAPEGLTLSGKNGGESVEYAPISDITGATVLRQGRKAALTVSFGTARSAWTFTGLQPAVAEWAAALIGEELSAQKKSTRPEYSAPVPFDRFSAISKEIIENSNSHAPVDVVDFFLSQAVHHSASDVHFDPFSDALVVRFRLDGVLCDVARVDGRLKKQVTSRLKVISRLATFKNTVAQEGRAALRLGDRTVDFRFSSLPTIHGEKVTVRIFDPQKSIFDLGRLGMTDTALESFKKMLMQPQGTILLTGPASSGKTTTMYASLSYLRENRKNLSSIATVEDPVEYDLQVVNQTQVNSTSGLTFANALKTVLRQDPEVIMIGEIRDRETADIATQAGLTGHMVLSTVHARSASGVLLRLVDLGVEPFLVASSVSAVLSQRLVRAVCKHCARPYQPTEDEKRRFNLKGDDRFVMGAGCEKCGGTGYSDRTGIFQLLPVSEALREMLLQRASLGDLESQVAREGVKTLLDDGLNKARAGVTTLEELTRVLG